jgi:hypothetical protein
MIEGAYNTSKFFRNNCSSSIIRSLKWIFNLDDDSEKVVFRYVKSSTRSTLTGTHGTMKEILTNKLYDLAIQLGLSWIRSNRPVYVDITLVE